MRHGKNAIRYPAGGPSYLAVSRELGLDLGQLTDFSAPGNAYFPTAGLFDELAGQLRVLLRSHPSDSALITDHLSAVLNLNPRTLTLGNGTTELLTWVDHLLVDSSIAIPVPTSGRWVDQPLETGKRVDMFPLRAAENFELRVDAYVEFIRQRGSRAAVLCNPNNPDGGYLPRREVLRFMDQLADLDLVIIDESFIDFVELERNPSVAVEATLRPNVIVMRSLGKTLGLNGVRLGYQVSNPALSQRIGTTLPKWNLNSLAEMVVFMLTEHWDEYTESLKLLVRDRFMMSAELGRFPELTVYSSQASFLLIGLPGGVNCGELAAYLLGEHNILVRECGTRIGMAGGFIRVSVRPEDDVDRLVEGLRGFARAGSAVELVASADERAFG